MNNVPTATPHLMAAEDGPIGLLTLSDPERRNALSTEVFLALHDVLAAWGASGCVRVVVIRGAGDRAFSSGYDIGAIPTNPSPDRQRIMREESPLERGLEAILDFPFPVIAMIRGACFGAALHLAMCCDIRLGADDVKMSMPPARLGLVYPPDGVARFLAVLGSARTREIFFTGRTYHGAEALETGLVDRMFPVAELESKTFAMAGEIAGNSPLALRGLKRTIRLLEEVSPLGAAARAECERLAIESFSSADANEGQTAFREKRSPTFCGR